jgi:hypothetical protein
VQYANTKQRTYKLQPPFLVFVCALSWLRTTKVGRRHTQIAEVRQTEPSVVLTITSVYNLHARVNCICCQYNYREIPTEANACSQCMSAEIKVIEIEFFLNYVGCIQN